MLNDSMCMTLQSFMLQGNASKEYLPKIPLGTKVCSALWPSVAAGSSWWSLQAGSAQGADHVCQFRIFNTEGDTCMLVVQDITDATLARWAPKPGDTGTVAAQQPCQHNMILVWHGRFRDIAYCGPCRPRKESRNSPW